MIDLHEGVLLIFVEAAHFGFRRRRVKIPWHWRPDREQKNAAERARRRRDTDKIKAKRPPPPPPVTLAFPPVIGRCARCGGVTELRPGCPQPTHLGECRIAV